MTNNLKRSVDKFHDLVDELGFGSVMTRDTHVQFLAPDGNPPVPVQLKGMLDVCSRACIACQRCCKGFSCCDPIKIKKNVASFVEKERKAILENWKWVPLLRPDNPVSFYYTCSALTDQGCAVYADRPATCRSFLCQWSFDGQEMPLEGSVDELTGLFGIREQAVSLTEAADKMEKAGFLEDTFIGRTGVRTSVKLKDLDPLLLKALENGLLIANRKVPDKYDPEMTVNQLWKS